MLKLNYIIIKVAELDDTWHLIEGRLIEMDGKAYLKVKQT